MKLISKMMGGIGVLGFAGILAAPTATASIPDPNGTYHGCVLSATGVLRVIDPATSSCLPILETPITWNQPAATNGFEVTTFTTTSPVSGGSQWTEENFNCPAGQTYMSQTAWLHAIGNGSFDFVAISPKTILTTGGKPTGVSEMIPNGWASTDPVTVQIVCGNTT